MDDLWNDSEGFIEDRSHRGNYILCKNTAAGLALFLTQPLYLAYTPLLMVPYLPSRSLATLITTPETIRACAMQDRTQVCTEQFRQYLHIQDEIPPTGCRGQATPLAVTNRMMARSATTHLARATGSQTSLSGKTPDSILGHTTTPTAKTSATTLVAAIEPGLEILTRLARTGAH
ncbi:hypothetical protein B0H11DRAFT_2226627 [Mycena galericulata]|nr:hypothetical protein B0H11DRAFT_2226627 [Mycena galericulata]